MTGFNPAYMQLLENGELPVRVARGHEMLQACTMCGHNCRKDRLAGQRGICRTAAMARIASYGPHHGEERPLSGWNGSGTIFFALCNLRCQFCQNASISQTDSGPEATPQELALMMLELQAQGCHNINLVSPTHVVAQILEAIWIAAQGGLHLPVVYNTGGYDSLEALELLDGVVDIYMPDMKYASDRVGLHYSKARNYPQVNQAAVREMHRQVGDLQLDEHGIAQHGLLVRHLVLPYDLAGTFEITHFLAQEISKDTYLNIMDQYYPAYNASQHPKLNRRIHPEEYQSAVACAQQAGLWRLDHE